MPFKNEKHKAEIPVKKSKSNSSKPAVKNLMEHKIDLLQNGGKKKVSKKILYNLLN